MGDRVNFVFKEGDDQPVLVLYSHWGWTSRHEDLAAALNHAKPRWGDTSYANRMVISWMLNGQLMDETGYGIYALAPDKLSELWDDCVTIDWANKMVDGHEFDKYINFYSENTCTCGCAQL